MIGVYLVTSNERTWLKVQTALVAKIDSGAAEAQDSSTSKSISAPLDQFKANLYHI